MSATAKTAEATEGQPRCWSCGGSFAEKDLVRLGSHPEVGLCTRCAFWVHRRATEAADARRGGIAAQYRGALARGRRWVMRHELQNRPVIGQLLRGLDRLLP